MNSIVKLGDCMDFMKDMPDKAYDLAICDPPYGINMSNRTGTTYKKGFGGKGFRSQDNKYLKKEWDNNKPNENYFNELFRVSRNQVIWGGNYHLLPISRGWIYWDKKLSNPNDKSYADGELAWTSFDRNLKKITYDWIGLGSINSGEIRIHVTQKPVMLYKNVLENYAKQGDKILDTHGGSMSSVIACLDYGFEITCFEKDADYYNSAKKRIESHITQCDMFKRPEIKFIDGVE